MGITVTPVRKLVQAGVLDWPLKVTVGGPAGFHWKQTLCCGRTDLVPQPVPPELNYDLWLGPAPKNPYHPHRVHQSFRGYWDYDGGGLGDMGQHYLDPVQYILGKDEESPIEVEADAPKQDRDAVGPSGVFGLKYKKGGELIFDGRTRNKAAPFIRGPKAK